VASHFSYRVQSRDPLGILSSRKGTFVEDRLASNCLWGIEGLRGSSPIVGEQTSRVEGPHGGKKKRKIRKEVESREDTYSSSKNHTERGVSKGNVIEKEKGGKKGRHQEFE